LSEEEVDKEEIRDELHQVQDAEQEEISEEDSDLEE
jgi:hypothetical protein